MEAGSDPGGMRTRAVRDGDEWVINGEKNWITNLGIADFFVVSQSQTPRPATRAASPRLSSRRTCRGVSIGKLEHKMGIRGSPTGQPAFDDVRVPANHLIRKEGEGFKVAMGTLDHSRLGVAAQGPGIAQGATDFARDYARERKQFGKPISSFEGIQFKLRGHGDQLRGRP